MGAKTQKAETFHFSKGRNFYISLFFIFPMFLFSIYITLFSHKKKHTKQQITPFTRSDFSCGLGSTDSCPTTVHMKPFSASVLQDPSGVFATTTKICTDGGSGQARAHNPSTLTVATPLLVGASALRLSLREEAYRTADRRPGIGTTL